MKICTKCRIERPLNKFYVYKNVRKGKYRPECQDCRNAWEREYRKKEGVKERRREKGNKWEQNNLNDWGKYIPTETKCQVCGTTIFFNKKNTNISIHFDHKNENLSIKESPKQWLLKHSCTEDNIIIWRNCNFGMLCGKCNRCIPTKNRKEWVNNVVRYLDENSI